MIFYGPSNSLLTTITTTTITIILLLLLLLLLDSSTEVVIHLWAIRQSKKHIKIIPIDVFNLLLIYGKMYK